MTSIQDEDYEEWEYDPDYTNWDELNNRFPLIHNVGNVAPYDNLQINVSELQKRGVQLFVSLRPAADPYHDRR